MSKSRLTLALTLGGLFLVAGCNKDETNNKPVSVPNGPATAPSHNMSSTQPSATGGTETSGATTSPSLALPPIIPGAGGPATAPSSRPTGSSGSGSGSGSSGAGGGSSSDLNK
jgi:hypothetical protein